MLKDTLTRLNEVTFDCRDDMHEPDEQGITAVVTGYHLDNAMGYNPNDNCGEFTIGISRDNGSHYEWFNMADVIALARKAKI